MRYQLEEHVRLDTIATNIDDSWNYDTSVQCSAHGVLFTNAPLSLHYVALLTLTRKVLYKSNEK